MKLLPNKLKLRQTNYWQSINQSLFSLACVAAGLRTRLNHLYSREGLERLRRRQYSPKIKRNILSYISSWESKIHKTYCIQIIERSKIISKNNPIYKNVLKSIGLFISRRWALLFLSRYFVSFFFGMMLLSGRSGSTERTLNSFLSAFSKSCRMSILLDLYFLLKHRSRRFVWPWDLSLQRHKQADHKRNSEKPRR